MKIGKEDIELIKVMDWVRFNNLDKFIWHTANERSTSPQSGQILKRKGVKAGVSDLTIMRPSNGFPGAFIELKSASGKLSQNQKQFLEDMAEEGYYTDCCFSASSAIASIKWYLEIVGV